MLGGSSITGLMAHRHGWPWLALLVGWAISIVPAMAATGQEPLRPLVLVPGATGVELVDGRTGAMLWGTGERLVSPKDGALSMAVPLDGSSDSVVPGAVMRRVSLGPIRKDVYGPWIDAIVEAGYAEGSIDSPGGGNDLYLFAYDWRQDNLISAQQLAEFLLRLRDAHGGTVEVDLVCQSNGALICRWLSKFGGATLEQAEAGEARPLEGLRIVHSFLVGTSSGGALRVLRLMHQGRRYVPVVGRKMSPEAIFTFPSLYQDLPTFASDLFVDEQGNDLSIDLFDAGNWEKLGWSIFANKPSKAFLNNPRMGGPEQWRAHLEVQLDRAVRLHAQLHKDSPAFSLDRLVLLQSRDLLTDRRAVVFRRSGKWKLAFAGDRGPGSFSSLKPRLLEPGDHHATVTSQVWLSEQEAARLESGQTVAVPGRHFEIILDPSAIETLLSLVSRSTETLRILDHEKR